MTLLLGMVYQSNAQEKGQFWVGGTLGFSSIENDDQKVERYTIGPEFGYQFSENWGAGIRVGYTNGLIKIFSETNRKDKSNGISIEPFARYTYLRWKAFGLFVDGGLNYTNATVKKEYASATLNSKVTNSNYGIFLSPGFTLRLSNTISLTGSLDFFDAGYNEIKTKGSSNKTKSYSANLNSPFDLDNFTLGFNFRF